MKLVANVCMYNEVEKGNLERCLANLKQYCDEIIIYDDASTDSSVEVALDHTNYMVLGTTNNHQEEVLHKQMLLEQSIAIGATHIFWLDCDEILDRAGTLGGLRKLCEEMSGDIDAYSFREINFWRSQRWVRTDSRFCETNFVRLWKVTPDMTFNITKGYDQRLFPITIKNIRLAPYSVLHYGFSDYKRMLKKIGADHMTKAQLSKCAETNWILNETSCSCYRAVDDIYPTENIPTREWPQPKPIAFEDLIPFSELMYDS